MSDRRPPAEVVDALAPTGVLRAVVNLGNPVLAQGTPREPAGVTVFAVPDASPVRTADDVDRAGVRIGVKEGSAYDLFLTRTVTHAEVVRGADGTAVFEAEGLDVAAGIRQPLTRYAADHGLRVVEPRFTEIRQAVATGRGRDPAAVAWLAAVVGDLRAGGFVAASLARSGQDATVPTTVG